MKPEFGATAESEFGRARWLTAFVVAAILYGSLYPFAFHATGSITNALEYFFGTWNQLPRSRGDLIANVLLYIPLGLTLSLSLSRRLRAADTADSIAIQ